MEHSVESYELLTQSTEDSSEEIQHIVRKRPYRKTRQNRAKSLESHLSTRSADGNSSKLYISLVVSCFVGITVWIFILTWLSIQLKIEMQAVRNLTDRVSAGNEGIPELIQECHTLTRELEKNQTKLIYQLQRATQRLTNFSNLLSGLKDDLSKLEKKLDGSPPRFIDPNSVQTLTSNVASFRDQIDELQSKANSIADEQAQLKVFVNAIKAEVSSFNDDLQDLRKHPFESSLSPTQTNKEDLVNLVISKIKPDIIEVNTPLRNQVKYLSDDLRKAEKNISNLADESVSLKTHIKTIHNDLKDHTNDLKVLQNDVKDHYKEWNQLMGEMIAIQSNITKIFTSCSHCIYLHGNESVTGIPPFSSSSAVSTSPTHLTPNTTVT